MHGGCPQASQQLGKSRQSLGKASFLVQLHCRSATAHSSSGLGHRPLTAAARVRIPYGPSSPAWTRGIRLMLRVTRAGVVEEVHVVPPSVPLGSRRWTSAACRTRLGPRLCQASFDEVLPDDLSSFGTELVAWLPRVRHLNAELLLRSPAVLGYCLEAGNAPRCLVENAAQKRHDLKVGSDHTAEWSHFDSHALA